MKSKITDESMLVTRCFEVPDFRASVEENKKSRRVEGHPAVFNSETSIGGWYNEIIERGAFDGCNFDDVLFFVNHDTYKIPLARSRRNNANSTMQLKIDDIGLFMGADLDVENNQEARQLCSSIDRKDVSGMSFMFRVKEQKWENLDTPVPTRRILKISKVYEVSAVNSPAYDKTDINARDKEALENAKLALENARSKELENSKALDIYKLKNKILGGI
ncbi:hypothetical protein SDC9_73214 [bioreactor metagenome]|uniref:Prohead serine protease domain-containing protein n=1 Tax=bioreactor metagenome TaxID=1076179 RepID=A0A644YE43_9ZZZZ